MPSITITYPAGDGARFASALGKHLNLIDNEPAPQPRVATAAECKAFVIDKIKEVVVDIETAELHAAAPPIVVPSVDMT